VVYGGVIFRRSERNDIQELKDIRGKSFAAVDETSFGGWRMAWRELKRAGINPYRHFSSLTFMGTCDAVVYAVLKGEVDAATVRTDILEGMAAEGKINLANVVVLNTEHYRDPSFITTSHEQCPFLHSTPLYPEWPFARLAHTPDKLAEQVAVALFKMPESSDAANAAMCAGWTVPLDYTTVEACLKDIEVGPFASNGKVNIKDVFKAYWPQLIGIALLLSVLFSIYVTLFNQRLASEVIERKSAEQALQAAYFDVEQIIQTISSGMRIIDRDFNVIKANAALAEFTGQRAAEIQGSKCYDSFPSPQCHTEECPLVLTLAGRRVQEQELTRTGPDGSPSICILSAWPFKDAEGNIIGMLEEVRDITESKQAEEALREGQVIAAELAAIQKTTATYAHEVNNPLAGILATIQLLAESDSARDEEKEMLADALHAAYRIRDVILEMQVMAKPKYRRYLDRSEIIDLRDDADTGLPGE
jgi:two-component system sensor histidine kinase TtrS